MKGTFFFNLVSKLGSLSATELIKVVVIELGQNTESNLSDPRAFFFLLDSTGKRG